MQAESASQAEQDEFYMGRCLELAARALGQTSPNPLVGAVVVSADGRVVGEGFHSRAGEPHAEPLALAAAAAQARGGTLYVNLEPCSHFGRTPPCAEAVVRAGLKRVVVGTVDPNEKVAGAGLRLIQESGIEVLAGVRVRQCRELNRGFLKSMEAGLPWLDLKLAATLDGRIADRRGTSRYVTGSAALERVQTLRSQVDAILVGAATARLDDPALTWRLPDGRAAERQPVRVVFDPALTLSESSRLFQRPGGKTFIFYRDDSQTKSRLKNFAQLEGDFAEFVGVEGDADNALDLRHCLELLGGRGLRRLLCEGGGRLAGSLLAADLVDEVHWFVAPKLLCDASAPLAVASPLERPLSAVLQLEEMSVTEVLPDFLLHGWMPGRSAFLSGRTET